MLFRSDHDRRPGALGALAPRAAPAVGRFGGPSVRPRADFRLGSRLRVALRARARVAGCVAGCAELGRRVDFGLHV